MEFQRILSASDGSASWLESKLARLKLNWFLTGLSVILLLVAWNRGIALLYGLVALIVATLIVAWIAPRCNLLGVTATRSVPATAVEGEKVQIIFDLKLSGWLSRYLIEVWDHLPFATENNQQSMAFVPMLTHQLSITVSIPCDLRGVHQLGPLVLKTGFPLGISHQTVEIDDSQTNIVVYPQPLKIHHFDIGTYRNNQADEAYVQQHSKGHDEFAGVREYRHGDAMRHIHWPSSARRGELIVREFHPLTTTHLSVLLDLQTGTDIGSGKHSTLEYAVKIAVSLGDYAIQQGIPFSLSGSNQHLQSIQTYKSPAQRQGLLESLAWVKADGKCDYQQIIRQFVAQQSTGGSVILFDNGQLNLQSSINLLLARHYQPIIYRFDVPTFESKRFQTAFVRTNERGIPVFVIQRGTDLARLFQ
ncbi:MAG: DUF58 domain-containing protein [Methylococcales bacterium]